ncbi:ribokinase [Agrococcus jenensis]|uniref:Ribokinase n=1 Tax=Agrococcus jenensis TaxID=46353 RepID=A0A3N2ASI7_9MICO|nr:ribokinase [Agrococcus jenensis]ROR65702.1 ribokinase [Agrococcus jenensis]
MPETSGVLIVGSINVDLTTFSARVPERGETITGDAFELQLGGKGANQAVAVARAGATAHMVGCVGDDVFGRLVTESLGTAGVDLQHVRTVPGQTGIAHIRVADDGDNDIVVVPQANASLDAAQLEHAFSALAGSARVLLTQLETPFAITLAAARLAREAGMTVILDPAPAAPLDPAIWPLVDIVKPNESEASLLTGIRVDSREGAIAAGRWFLERGAGAALITMGGAGSVLITAEGATDHPSIPVEVVDTTAAGDAYAGALAAAIAAGLPLEQAIRRAAAAGAIAVTRRGSSSSVPTAAEVDALLG